MSTRIPSSRPAAPARPPQPHAVVDPALLQLLRKAKPTDPVDAILTFRTTKPNITEEGFKKLLQRMGDTSKVKSEFLPFGAAFAMGFVKAPAAFLLKLLDAPEIASAEPNSTIEAL